MAREAKSYDHLIGKIDGLTENQLKAHFTLYQGYVKKLNEIEERLGAADRSTANYSFSEYSELKRREPVAYNGTFLHELYFDNLGGAGTEAGHAFKKAVTQWFGSYENWAADVKAGILSGHGWVITTYAWPDRRVRNVFIQSEHHVGLQVDSQVLVAVDGWEHAYFMDYGTKKADYVATVMKNLDWKVIDERAGRAGLNGD